MTLLLPVVLSLALSASESLRFVPAQPPLPVGPMAGLPEVADMNRDGHADVVVACGPCCGMEPSPEAGHVQVLLGDGTGKLRPAGPAVEVGPSALRVAIGDVNGDELPDVACVQHSSWEASILLGDGEGGLERASTVTLLDRGDPHVHSVALADVDHDGHLDLLATLVSAHAVAVFLGDGTGGFAPSLGSPYFAHRHPYEQLTVLELNGDGHPDLLCTDVAGNALTVLLGSGTGMFASSRGFLLEGHTRLVGAERPMALAVGDLDLDGRPDVVAGLDEEPRVVVLAGGGAVFAQVGEPLDTAAWGPGVRLADFDRDGHLDLATGGVSVSRGGPGFAFEPARRVHGGGSEPSVAVGDFDGDGRPDLVCSSYRDGTVNVLLSRSGR